MTGKNVSKSSRQSQVMVKPSHWPPQITYISTCLYHSSVSAGMQQFIQGPAASGSTHGRASETLRRMVVIRPITNTAHPAYGQYGLFAGRKIPRRTHILDYTGEVHADDRPESDYDISLYRSQDGTAIGIDASNMGNEGRFINDYRGIGQKANAIFIDSRSSTGELGMSIWSAEDEIKKGEEILVSYGKSWWRARTEDADHNYSIMYESNEGG